MAKLRHHRERATSESDSWNVLLSWAPGDEGQRSLVFTQQAQVKTP
jgi:hypothetical protein